MHDQVRLSLGPILILGTLKCLECDDTIFVYMCVVVYRLRFWIIAECIVKMNGILVCNCCYGLKK